MRDDEIDASAFPLPDVADLDDILSALKDDDASTTSETAAITADATPSKRKGVRMSKADVKAASRSKVAADDGLAAVQGDLGSMNGSAAGSKNTDSRNHLPVLDENGYDLVPPPPSDFMFDEVDDGTSVGIANQNAMSMQRSAPMHDMQGAMPPLQSHSGAIAISPDLAAQLEFEVQQGFSQRTRFTPAPSAHSSSSVQAPRAGSWRQQGTNPLSGGNCGVQRLAFSVKGNSAAQMPMPGFNDYVDPVESARQFRHHARQGVAQPSGNESMPPHGTVALVPWQNNGQVQMQGGTASQQQVGVQPNLPAGHMVGNVPISQTVPQAVVPQGQMVAGAGGQQRVVPQGQMVTGAGGQQRMVPQGQMVAGAGGQQCMVPQRQMVLGAMMAQEHGGRDRVGAALTVVSSGQEQVSAMDVDAQIVRNMAGPRAKALSVSDFVSVTDNFLGSLGEVVVSGEISQINERNHLYFSLKDENSKVDCLMFVRDRRALNFTPAEGQKVFVQGKSSLYKVTGVFKLIATKMSLAGSGMILEQLRQLEHKLEQEGVFNRHLPLPPLIQRVAIVTSVDGRVIDDIATNAFRRNPLVELIFLDTKVQGQDAVPQILNALSYAYNNAARWQLDVIIIGRGGGSFEDLLCFSDERVVRMVAMSPVPIISAVGHDEDCPLCDRSADLRVSTPTAAAEKITPITRADLLAYLESQIDRAEDFILRRLDNLESRFEHLLTRLTNAPVSAVLDRRNAKLYELLSRIDHAKDRLLNERHVRLANAREKLEQVAGLDRVHDIRLRIDNAINRLDVVHNRLAVAKSATFNLTNSLERHIALIDQKLKGSAYTIDANILPRADQAITYMLESRKERLLLIEHALTAYYDHVLSNSLSTYSEKLLKLLSKLESLDPLYQLKLGLSVTTKDGKHSVKGEDLAIGDTIITLMQGYKVTSSISDIQSHDFKSASELADNA